MKLFFNTSYLFFLLLLLVACNANTDMTTIINDDGSCERILTASVNDKFIQGDTAKQPFPMELTGWDIRWKYKNQQIVNSWPAKDFKKAATDSTDKLIAIARKHFRSVEQLSDSFKLKPSHAWKAIVIKPVLEKQFRWFYTYYNYQETFSKLPITFAVPLEKYLDKDEAGYWFAGQPDIVKGLNGVEAKELLDGIEKKAEEWLMRNVFEQEYNEVLNHLAVFENNVTSAHMALLKDSLFSRYHQAFSTEKKTNILTLLEEGFNIRVSDKISKVEKDSLANSIKDAAKLDELSSYFEASFDYKLMIPGHLMASNGVIANDTLSWKIDAYRLINGNFTIDASSRQVNRWMLVVTGFVVAGTIGLFFIRRK